MKFTLSWLKKHLDTDASIDEITSALTDLGNEHQGFATFDMPNLHGGISR